MKPSMMRALLVAATALLGGCAGAARPATGLVAGRLAPCPAAPKCVSSQASDAEHAVAPFVLAQPGPQSWARVAAVVATLERTTVVEQTGRYLRAEARSRSRLFTDDLELLLAEDGKRVDVRSSARAGYYDFGVNRGRVEELRTRLGEMR